MATQLPTARTLQLPAVPSVSDPAMRAWLQAVKMAIERTHQGNFDNDTLVRDSLDTLTTTVGTLPTTFAALTDVDVAGVATGDVLAFDGTDWRFIAASADGYVLTTHSSTAAPDWKSLALSVTYNATVFTSNGTFTKPANVSQVVVEMVGGGGGGGSAAGAGGNGGTSSFGNFCSAAGGRGGTNTGGLGSTGSGGDINVVGNAGGYGIMAAGTAGDLVYAHGGGSYFCGGASVTGTGRAYGGGGAGYGAAAGEYGVGGGGAGYARKICSITTNVAVTVGTGGAAGAGGQGWTGAAGVVVVSWETIGV